MEWPQGIQAAFTGLRAVPLEQPGLPEGQTARTPVNRPGKRLLGQPTRPQRPGLHRFAASPVNGAKRSTQRSHAKFRSLSEPYPMKAKATTIDEYLAPLSADKRAALEKLRKTIKAAAPMAEEYIGYGLAAFRLDGRPLVAM